MPHQNGPEAESAGGLPSHYPALDGVRGIAIVWVIAHNVAVADGAWFPNLAGRLFAAGTDAGWVAVTLFFALSGFLITGILLDSRQLPDYYRSFYARRVLRIFPLYYAVLLVAFVLLPLVMSPLPPRLAADQPDQFWLWAYLSNWTQPRSVASNAFPHFWSLAVEEQFYLLWPLLVRPRSARGVLQLCIGVAALSLGIRAGMVAMGASEEALYTFSVSRMDALALGGAAAALLRMPHVRARLMPKAAAVMAAAAAVFVLCVLVLHGLPRDGARTHTVGYTLLAISFALLMLALALADTDRSSSWWSVPWRAAPLRVLAKYSYAMYVFHKILAEVVGQPLMRSQGDAWLKSLPVNVSYVVVNVLASLVLAMLSYHLFEKRFLQLKPRFALSRAATVASA